MDLHPVDRLIFFSFYLVSGVVSFINPHRGAIIQFSFGKNGDLVELWLGKNWSNRVKNGLQ